MSAPDWPADTSKLKNVELEFHALFNFLLKFSYFYLDLDTYAATWFLLPKLLYSSIQCLLQWWKLFSGLILATELETFRKDW